MIEILKELKENKSIEEILASQSDEDIGQAVLYNDCEVLRWLINDGNFLAVYHILDKLSVKSVVDLIRNSYSTVLLVAQKGDGEMIDKLLQKITDKSEKVRVIEFGLRERLPSSILIAALEAGNFETYNKIFSLLSESTKSDMSQSTTILASAAKGGNVEIVRMILALTVDPARKLSIITNDIILNVIKKRNIEVFDELFSHMSQEYKIMRIRDNHCILFLKALESGYLDIVERLLDMVPPEQKFELINNSVRGLRVPLSKGNFAVVNEIFNSISEEQAWVIIENNLYLIGDATKGNIKTFNRLLKVVPNQPEQQWFMIMAQKVLAVAVATNRVSMIERVFEMADTFERRLSMIRADEYFAFAQALRAQSFRVINRLFDELPEEDERTLMIRNNRLTILTIEKEANENPEKKIDFRNLLRFFYICFPNRPLGLSPPLPISDYNYSAMAGGVGGYAPEPHLVVHPRFDIENDSIANRLRQVYVYVSRALYDQGLVKLTPQEIQQESINVIADLLKNMDKFRDIAKIQEAFFRGEGDHLKFPPEIWREVAKYFYNYQNSRDQVKEMKEKTEANIALKQEILEDEAMKKLKYINESDFEDKNKEIMRTRVRDQAISDIEIITKQEEEILKKALKKAFFVSEIVNTAIYNSGLTNLLYYLDRKIEKTPLPKDTVGEFEAESVAAMSQGINPSPSHY